MYFDANLIPTSLTNIPAFAQAAERLGFDALWVSETMHDPFLPAALIGEHTHRTQFGTAIAVAFARSPATLAYTAWDLAQASGGRFILGLGTQVKAHIERRFGMPWPESPVNKLREQIAAIRAFWKTWQEGEPLNQRGEYYKLTLISPFFNPGPIESPDIPIFIAGVNTGLARLAGETADGFNVHPFHSPRYLKEAILPGIEQGLAKTGRTRAEIQVFVTAFIATTPAEQSFCRQQIAFYASTPSYRSVMAHHGWESTAEMLSGLAGRGLWGEMPGLIDDEMLETFALLGTPEQIPGALVGRYRDLADRLSLYSPFLIGERDDFWRSMIVACRESG